MKSVENSIKEFEKKENIKIPTDYVMNLTSGALLSKVHHTFDFVGADGYDNSTGVDEFFSFDNGANSVQRQFAYYRDSRRMAPYVLPIGSCIAGNIICLDFRRTSPGLVYYWDQELELDLSMEKNLAVLAPNVSSFLRMLYPDK